MSGQEKLNEFLESVDAWIVCKGLPTIKKNTYAEDILNMKSQELSILSSRECLMYAYELYAYGEYVESIKVKQKIVLDWANSSIWYIISQSLDSYGGSYTKWEQKYYSAVKENPLASEILKIKKHAEARLANVESMSSKIQRMADTLSNLSKTK